jgi:hypothetical protein
LPPRFRAARRRHIGRRGGGRCARRRIARRSGIRSGGRKLDYLWPRCRRSRCRGIRRRSSCERLTLILAGQRLGFTLAEIRDLLGKPGGKTLHLTREKCIAQIRVLEQQKRNIEISIAELRQIYSSFYKKLLETG